MSTTSNELTKNYSGIFGNQVLLKNRGGRSVMTIPPYRTSKEPTPGQIAVRKRFFDAVSYARTVLQDPEMLAAYTAKAEKGTSAYIVALTDFLRPPWIDQIDTSAYEGKVGDVILVEAGDDFGLEKVRVHIFDSNGITIEKGEGVLIPRLNRYVFTATVDVSDLSGVRVMASVFDFPGHTAESSITL